MADLTGTRVAIIALDHFERSELTEPRDQLSASGAEVKVYSAEPGSIRAKEGDTEDSIEVQVDGLMSDLNVVDLDALVVPGGTVNADHLRQDEDARRLVRDAVEGGTPTAIICHGPWVLIDSGVASGRRVTSYPSLAPDLQNAGATWVDEEVVVDGSLITSRTPKDLPAFISAIEDALS